MLIFAKHSQLYIRYNYNTVYSWLYECKRTMHHVISWPSLLSRSCLPFCLERYNGR